MLALSRLTLSRLGGLLCRAPGQTLIPALPPLRLQRFSTGRPPPTPPRGRRPPPPPPPRNKGNSIAHHEQSTQGAPPSKLSVRALCGDGALRCGCLPLSESWRAGASQLVSGTASRSWNLLWLFGGLSFASWAIASIPAIVREQQQGARPRFSTRAATPACWRHCRRFSVSAVRPRARLLLSAAAGRSPRGRRRVRAGAAAAARREAAARRHWPRRGAGGQALLRCTLPRGCSPW
eukprot:SAG11_NODE_7887_length_1084_cov_1.457868_1_plen_235_part_00